MTKEEMRHMIAYEAIVDANDEGEVNMSWYYFFEDTLSFPLVAETGIKARDGKEHLTKVNVLGLVSDRDLEESPDILFEVSPLGSDMVLEVRLSKLKNVKADKEGKTAFELWHFWKSDDY